MSRLRIQNTIIGHRSRGSGAARANRQKDSISMWNEIRDGISFSIWVNFRATPESAGGLSIDIVEGNEFKNETFFSNYNLLNNFSKCNSYLEKILRIQPRKKKLTNNFHFGFFICIALKITLFKKKKATFFLQTDIHTVYINRKIKGDHWKHFLVFLEDRN